MPLQFFCWRFVGGGYFAMVLFASPIRQTHQKTHTVLHGAHCRPYLRCYARHGACLPGTLSSLALSTLNMRLCSQNERKPGCTGKLAGCQFKEGDAKSPVGQNGQGECRRAFAQCENYQHLPHAVRKLHLHTTADLIRYVLSQQLLSQPTCRATPAYR